MVPDSGGPSVAVSAVHLMFRWVSIVFLCTGWLVEYVPQAYVCRDRSPTVYIIDAMAEAENINLVMLRARAKH